MLTEPKKIVEAFTQQPCVKQAETLCTTTQVTDEVMVASGALLLWKLV